MGNLLTYRLEESVATIALDDGKANVLSPRMLEEINAALDRAAADGAAVVLGGREGVFSGGFDLAVLRAGGADAIGMVRGGFELAARLLSFPAPVVIACTGHAVAMGVFLVLSGDYRVGASGPFKILANEVAIGLTMPFAAIEICRQRLTPAAFNRAVILSEPFSPDTAVAAGFLDQVVEASAVEKVAHDTAVMLSKLDRGAHAATKQRARQRALDAVRGAIEAEDAGALRPGDADR